ncbi:MAG: PGPGW domain-containing protein [Patescibacteria group bacterium]
MKEKIVSKFKSSMILSDVTGVIMVIIGIIIGPLPGPGFVPFFFGGLGLMSLHHPSIARKRDWLLKDGNDLLDKLFPDHHVIMILWDVAVVIGLCIGTFAILGLNGFLQVAFAAMGFTGAFIVFVKNRRRLHRYSQHRAKKKQK